MSFLPNSTPNPPSIPTLHKRSNKNHSTTTNKKKSKKKKKQPHPPPPPPPPRSSSWEQFKNLLSCKNATTAILPTQLCSPSPIKNPNNTTKHARLGSTCGSSICAIRDAVQAATRVTDHGSSSSDGGSRANDTTPLSAARSRGGGGMQLMKLSGCYECHAVDVQSASRRYPRPRTLCPCAECGEVFTKSESLELHQAIRHAVSELGPEDSGRNIVEIIFKSSWQKKDTPICAIDRILKVHNTQRTIARFEDYRDAVKARAQAHLLLGQPKSKNPRCAADGNELLRFHCTSISCSLGSNASTSLCLSSTGAGACSVCTIIRYGFSRAQQNVIDPTGVRTTASSGRAHDWGPQVESGPGGARRAMLVCRVIAGRVKRSGDETPDGSGPFDSVAGDGSLEELFVANHRAILPCFVVIYKALG